MAINGQIVDEINGLIASRDSIRTTMKAAGIASDTSKLADLATNLAAAKLGATTYNVSSSNQTIPAGKLTTGAQTFRAVTTSGIDAANIKSGAVIQVGDAGSAGRIKNVTGTFTAESSSPITADSILSGKVGYVNGSKVTGTIPTVTPSTTKLDCGKSASISKGYLASAVTITAKDLASQTPGTAAAGDILSGKTAWVGGSKVTGSMPNATITSGSATISSTTYTYNSANGNFSVTGSANVSAPTVGTAGYISSSEGTLKTNTANLSAAVAKIAGSTSISGTTTKQPSISRQSFTNISGITDASADGATTTAPTSSSTYKAWVKVKSAANTGSLTATPSVTTAGYGTSANHGIAAASATVGALASADTYIPIKNGAYSASVSTTAGSASMSATGVSTATSSNCYITLSTTAGSAKGTATVGTAGWVNTGSTSSSATSVSVSGDGTKLYLATYTPSTITVTNSSQTLLTNGKVCTGNITIPAVNYFYTSPEIPTSTSGYNDGDIWLVVNS